MQNVASLLSLILMAAIAGVFLWVAAGASGPAGDAKQIAAKGLAWRNRLFWFVVIAGIAIAFGTLWEWPMPGHAASADKPDVTVRATAHQWRWELSQDTVEVGKMIEFEVTAADVNHGFAIYRDKTTMVAQTQAMPGYTNRLRVRFAEPGDYEVLCLEYCGVAHHAMRTVIKVRPRS